MLRVTAFWIPPDFEKCCNAAHYEDQKVPKRFTETSHTVLAVKGLRRGWDVFVTCCYVVETCLRL